MIGILLTNSSSFVMFNPSIIRTTKTYTIAIKGTTTCATFDILFNPPIKTSATNTVSIIPEITIVIE